MHIFFRFVREMSTEKGRFLRLDIGHAPRFCIINEASTWPIVLHRPRFFGQVGFLLFHLQS